MSPGSAPLVLTAGLFLGTSAQYLIVGERPGAGVVVGIAAFLALAFGVRDDRWPRGAGEIGAAALALLFAGLTAIRTDVPLVAFDLVTAAGLCFVVVLSSRGFDVLRLRAGFVPAAVAASLSAVVVRLPGVYAIAVPAISARAQARSSRALPYASGLALALPFLVIFALLFSAADAVFSRSVRDVLDVAWLREVLPTLPQRIVVLVVATWCATGALAMSADRSLPRPAETRGRRLLDLEPAVVALVAIDLLFATFVALQLAYLFGGRDTLAASGIPYSEYARRGFFELVAVATLVGLLLFACDLLVRRRSRAYLSAALVLVGLTGVVLASAATRMTLYQQAYGWTELRLYAYAGIGFLAVALVILAAALLTGVMERTVPALSVAGLAIALCVNAIGPSRVVASANLDRVLHPASSADDTHQDLDIGYLVSLGDGAVPAIVERLASLPEAERAALRQALMTAASRRPALGGWQSWSWDRARATEMLESLRR